MVAKRSGGLLPLADQGVVSLSAFVGVLALAGVMDAAEFGVFAIPFTVLTLVVGVGRVYFGVPLTLLAARSSSLRELFGDSISALLLAALPVVAVVGVAGVLAGAPDGLSAVEIVAVVAVAVAAPCAIAVDICRYAAIAAGKAGRALAVDAVGFGAMTALLINRDIMGTFATIAVWAGVIAATSAAHLAMSKPELRLPAGAKLLVPAGRLRDSLALSVMLATGVTLLMGFFMLATLGPVAVAAIRGAGTLFGPINTAIAALDIAVLGRIAAAGSGRVRSTLRASFLLVIASGLWWVVLLSLPPSAGEFLLGETWIPTRTILPWTGIEYLLLCASAGLALLLKVQDRGRELLANRVLASVVILTGVPVALLLGAGLQGMAVALLAGAVASIVHLAVRLGRTPSDAAPVSRAGESPDRERDASP